MTHLLLYGNAYAQIIRNVKGEVIALYPLMANRMSVDHDDKDHLYYQYPGNVTVKIDGIAASAASVIAMAGTKVLVSPVSMLMIHNPMTAAISFLVTNC